MTAPADWGPAGESAHQPVQEEVTTNFDGSPRGGAAAAPEGGGWGGSPETETDSTGRSEGGTLQTVKGAPRGRGSFAGGAQQEQAPPPQEPGEKLTGEARWQRVYETQGRTGETLDDFKSRYAEQEAHRAGMQQKVAREATQELQRARQEMQNLQAQLRPLLEREARQRQWEATQQAAAEVPDDPAERTAWLVQRDIEERRAAAQQQQEEAHTREAIEAHQGRLASIDHVWGTELVQAVQDESFMQDFFQVSEFDQVMAQQAFDPVELAEPYYDPNTGRPTVLGDGSMETKGQYLIRISQLNAMRKWASEGKSVRGEIRRRAAEARRIFGGAQPQQQPAQQQPVHQQQGRQSPTAQQIMAESQRAEAGRVVSSPAASRGGGGGAGEGYDIDRMTPDQIIQAMSNGFDYDAALKAKYGQADEWNRWEGR